MAVKNEARHPGEYVASEAKGTRSREVVTLTGAVFTPGQVLGKITASGKYAPWDPAGGDGTENAAGICLDHYDASSADVNGVIHTEQWKLVVTEAKPDWQAANLRTLPLARTLVARCPVARCHAARVPKVLVLVRVRVLIAAQKLGEPCLSTTVGIGHEIIGLCALGC